MKSYFSLATLAILLAGCSQSPVTINPPQGQSQNKNQQVATTQTYRNGTYGFEFTYPETWQFVTPSYANLQDQIVQIQTPSDMYPATNFGDAAFSVSASYMQNPDDCYDADNAEQTKETPIKVTINGREFTKTTHTGAGAGNLYESTNYRIVTGERLCVELNQTIHTTNIGNYEPIIINEVSKAPIQQQLDSIVQSFTFTE